jgi:glutamyl-tRNA synthetase
MMLKQAKNWKEETTPLMQQLIMELEKIIDFTSLNIETIVKSGQTNEIEWVK